MARAGWYNENEYRDYPFLARSAPYATESSSVSIGVTELPHEAIVDFGCVCMPAAGFIPSQDYVYLAAIRRSGDVFEYEFRCTAENLAVYPLLFHRTVGDAEHGTEWVEAFAAGAESSVSGCVEEPLWTGFMVHGRLTRLLELLDPGEELTFYAGFWQIEPRCVQVLSFLQRINLANYSRTYAAFDAGAECSEPFPSRELFIDTVCIQDDVIFQEGYNCSIVQDDWKNSITIRTNKGGGAGEPCEEVPLYPGEDSPDGGRFLTGGIGCGDVLQTLNGVGGRHVSILAGPGIRVGTDSEDPNAVVVSVNLGDFVTCVGVDVGSSSSSAGET